MSRACRSALSVLLLVGLSSVVGSTAAAASTASDASTGFAAAGASAAAPGRLSVLVLGVPDLRWSDIDPAATPALWQLAAAGSTANLVVRGRREHTSPLDGWATFGAGNRAGESQLFRPGKPDTEWGQFDAGALTGSDGQALADALSRAGQCMSAPVGIPSLGPAKIGVEPQRVGCRVEVADSPSLVAAGPAPRATRLAQLDRWVGQQRADRPPVTLVVLAGLSDAARGPAHLHVLVISGAGTPAGGTLTSATTGLTGYVQLVDLAPTILHRLQIDVPASMIGAPVSAIGSPRSLANARAAFRGDDSHAVVAHRLLIPALLAWFAVVALGALVSGVLFRVGRPWAARVGARSTCLVLLVAPPASLLAGIVPWWRAGSWGLLLATLGAAGVLLAVSAGVAAGPTRTPFRWLLFVRVLLGCSALLVAFDLVGARSLFGVPLQLSSITGYNPLVAGRFIGIGNPGFGLFAASVLLVLSLSRWPLPVVAGLGMLAVLLDGEPSWGADIGGVIAFVPAVLVLLARRSGTRLTRRLIALAGLSVVLLLCLFALVDLARGSGQGHLGRFADTLVHGHAGLTLHRKLVADLELLFGNPVGPLFLIAFAAALVLLRAALRPGDASGLVGPLRRTMAATPGLADGLVATGVAAGIGLFVNDSGIALAAATLLVAVPVTVIADCDLGLAGPSQPAVESRHARPDGALDPPVRRMRSPGVF
jgi:hypothetical protein